MKFYLPKKFRFLLFSLIVIVGSGLVIYRETTFIPNTIKAISPLLDKFAFIENIMAAGTSPYQAVTGDVSIAGNLTVSDGDKGIHLESSNGQFGFIHSINNLHLTQNSQWTSTGGWKTIAAGKAGGFQAYITGNEALRVFADNTSKPANTANEFKSLMVVKTDGKVGIGENFTDPAAKLHIKAVGGTGNEALRLQGSSTLLTLYNNSNAYKFALNLDTDVPTFYDAYDGSWHSSISLKNGLVGIGTANPTAKLEVAGGTIYLSGGGYIDFPSTFGNTDDGKIGNSLFGQGLTMVGINNDNTRRKFQLWGSIIQNENGTGGNTFKDSSTFEGDTYLAYLSGRVGVGLGSATSTLEVGGREGTAGSRNFKVKYPGGMTLTNTEFSALTNLQAEAGVTGWTAMYAYKGTGGAAYAGVFNGDVRISGNGWITSAWSTSDARFKKDVEKISNPLDKLKVLEGITFNWRKDEFPQMNFTAGRQYGLIAQDVEKIIPELVNTDNEGYKSVAYDKLTVVLLEAVKAQQKEIEELKKEIEELKAR